MTIEFFEDDTWQLVNSLGWVRRCAEHQPEKKCVVCCIGEMRTHPSDEIEAIRGVKLSGLVQKEEGVPTKALCIVCFNTWLVPDDTPYKRIPCDMCALYYAPGLTHAQRAARFIRKHRSPAIADVLGYDINDPVEATCIECGRGWVIPYFAPCGDMCCPECNNVRLRIRGPGSSYGVHYAYDNGSFYRIPQEILEEAARRNAAEAQKRPSRNQRRKEIRRLKREEAARQAEAAGTGESKPPCE